MFFWYSLAFSMIQLILAIWSLIPLPFLKPAWTSGSSRFMYCWSLAWRILSITLLACESAIGIHISTPFWNSFPSPSPFQPSRLIQSSCLSFLSHTANPHWLSILHMVMEKAMAPYSSTLAWKIPWTEEPGRLQSMGSRRVGHDTVTSLSLFTFMLWRRKWPPTPVFLPGESQGWGSLVGCRLWGCTESDMTEVT